MCDICHLRIRATLSIRREFVCDIRAVWACRSVNDFYLCLHLSPAYPLSAADTLTLPFLEYRNHD